MFFISGHCYKLIIYLPRTQCHHTNGVSIWAFLHLSHKLSQLGVCPTAVVNLKITKSHNDYPLLLLCHVLKNFIPKMCQFNLLFAFKYNLLSSHVLLPDHLRNQSCIEFFSNNVLTITLIYRVLSLFLYLMFFVTEVLLYNDVIVNTGSTHPGGP